MGKEGGGGGEIPPKMVQSDTSDFPSKKLARQLDFTAGFGGVSSGSVKLPEHPQSTQRIGVALPSAAVTVQQQQIKPPTVAAAAAVPVVALQHPPLTTASTRVV